MNAVPPETAPPPHPVTRVRARALLLGDRIDTAGLERSDMISATPLAFHAGAGGFVALYRFGVAVMIGLSPLEEDDVLTHVRVRLSGPHEPIEDETAVLEVSPDLEDKVPPGGAITLKDLSPQRLLVVADALAKSVSLARDEREVNAVFDIIEPFAADLAKHGRPPWRRRAMLKLIGQTLLAQHRVSGRVAVEEKPDVLWDRPDLERLYIRLEDEYELKERGETLKHKLDTIVETTRTLTDMIDANTATRLEATIVILIVAEILLTIGELLFWHR
ncbi:MAG TPA: RMD1 family protein [Methylocella sp.]|nr:RMD1 family protein [Methylocella sp.]